MLCDTVAASGEQVSRPQKCGSGYGSGGGGCAANGGGSGLDAEANIFAAEIRLNNNATPGASGFGGGLLSDAPVGGTQPITLSRPPIRRGPAYSR